MAVYKRSYRGYSGAYTPEWSRFLILTRYASQSLFKSKAITGFLIACLLPFVVTALLIYLNHNSSILSMLRVPGGQLFSIDAKFFRNFLSVQLSSAFIVTAFVGPGLISPDLGNNALVLYFCRPFSRTEYVLGKLTVLAKLLSVLTWIPGLILFCIQSSLAGWTWMVDNLFIAVAVFLGSVILILVLSLLALALSAWVKWKPVAGALVLGVIFMGAGFGAAINGVMRTRLGHLLSIPVLLQTVLTSLFRLDPTIELSPISPTLAWCGLLGIAGACLYLLSRKLRAYEVVR